MEKKSATKQIEPLPLVDKKSPQCILGVSLLEGDRMKYSLSLLMFSLMVTAFTLFAEEPVAPDAPLLLKPNVARYDYDAIPKDPLASAFFAATLPGSGQIYNKEYVRGMITGIGFYTGLFVTQYMVSRWEAQNTDTIYVEEYDKLGRWTGKYREFYSRPGSRGLPLQNPRR